MKRRKSIKTKSLKPRYNQYSLGGWISENSTNLLKSAAGGAMMATGIGAGVGASLLTSGATGIIDDTMAEPQQGTPINPYAIRRFNNMNNNGSTNMYYAQGGRLQPEASNAVIARGNTHAQGGIKLDGSTEVENNETLVKSPFTGETQVMSDKLGFADQTNPLVDKKGKLEQELQSNIQRLESINKIRSVSNNKFNTESNQYKRNTHRRNFDKYDEIVNKITNNINNLKLQINEIDKQVEGIFQQQQQVNGDNSGMQQPNIQQQPQQPNMQQPQQFEDGGKFNIDNYKDFKLNGASNIEDYNKFKYQSLVDNNEIQQNELTRIRQNTIDGNNNTVDGYDTTKNILIGNQPFTDYSKLFYNKVQNSAAPINNITHIRNNNPVQKFSDKYIKNNWGNDFVNSNDNINTVIENDSINTVRPRRNNNISFNNVVNNLKNNNPVQEFGDKYIKNNWGNDFVNNSNNSTIKTDSLTNVVPRVNNNFNNWGTIGNKPTIKTNESITKINEPTTKTAIGRNIDHPILNNNRIVSYKDLGDNNEHDGYDEYDDGKGGKFKIYYDTHTDENGESENYYVATDIPDEVIMANPTDFPDRYEELMKAKANNKTKTKNTTKTKTEKTTKTSPFDIYGHDKTTTKTDNKNETIPTNTSSNTVTNVDNKINTRNSISRMESIIPEYGVSKPTISKFNVNNSNKSSWIDDIISKYSKDVEKAIPYLDNVNNIFANSRLNNIKTPTYNRAYTPTLDKTYNINPQLNNIKSQTNAYKNYIDNNTNNSAVARSNMSVINNDNRKLINELYAAKDNKEMIVESQNLSSAAQVDAMNNKLDYENSMMRYKSKVAGVERSSANVANAVDKYNQLKTQDNMLEYQQKQLQSIAQRYPDSAAGIEAIAQHLNVSEDEFAKLCKEKGITGKAFEDIMKLYNNSKNSK